VKTLFLQNESDWPHLLGLQHASSGHMVFGNPFTSSTKLQ